MPQGIEIGCTYLSMLAYSRIHCLMQLHDAVETALAGLPEAGCCCSSCGDLIVSLPGLEVGDIIQYLASDTCAPLRSTLQMQCL